ncbi:MAG: L-2-amino-thiazoline-4-carboxylic acid hydrolase [Oscillospiraceae bacterium]|nr:L-2-amino-thiazoline-4-carboxylic acid hydrolase [Lachnospiraceae bacterium]MBR4473626.1 L-2-amino-thiazoline-4-carboxylic acid hydrolase [Oscillospiraceae bacterium]
MAGLEKTVKKAFIRYTKKHYPQEAERIIERAEELFPTLYSKAPFIGGEENLMAYNLDMMIIAASFYEASDHRINGESFLEMGKEILHRFAFLRKIVNLNHQWQMKIFRNSMYRRYVPYAKLVDEKLSRGEWGNTWRVAINPRNTDEGVCFDLIGCPLADYAKKNGYMDLLPHMCAIDHLVPELFHAKLIRTHTCALGSDSCDYWYVGDKSSTVKEFEGKIV